MSKVIIKVPNEDTVLNMTVTDNMVFHNQDNGELLLADVPALPGIGLVTMTLKQLQADGLFYAIEKPVVAVAAASTTKAKPTKKTTKKDA